MKSSNQDWYVCLHIMDKPNCPEVTTLGCVNISRLVHDNARPQLERYRLHPSEADDVSDTERDAPKEILFKNPLTNNDTIHRLEYDSANFGHDVFATIGTKVYVMVTNRDSTSFQVYDPSHDSWRTLPPLPSSDFVYSSQHYVCRHMICVCPCTTKGLKSYVFDTVEEKWFVPKVDLPTLECVVEFSGFLIGVLHYESPLCIAAYKLDDDNGLPDDNSRHILDGDMWELFCPPLTPENNGSSLQRFGDDQVVFISNIEGHNINGKLVVIAVFRISVSIVSGIPMISAALEHKQVYNLAKDYGPDQNEEYLNVRSTFIMRNAPSRCSRVSNILLEDPNGSNTISLRETMRQRKTRARGYSSSPEPIRHVRETSSVYDSDDYVVVVTEANESVVEWDEQLKEKSLYMCFVENRTDFSVSYIIKAIKFKDLISISSPDLNPKLHQVASTSGFHLSRLPSCGIFASQILFTGGGNEDYLGKLEPIDEDPYYSDYEYNKEVEVTQQVPINKSIYCYDVNSPDQIIKRFPSSFKGMKSQPILAEVKGKLYALANSPMPKHTTSGPSGPSFEVFDPIEKQWSPLPDPATYTKIQSSRNYHVVAGSNLLSWGGHSDYDSKSRISLFSPRVLRFDMAADKDWRLVNRSGALVDDKYWSLINDVPGSCSIAVDIGGGSFILFAREGSREDIVIQVHLISREFESVVTLPKLNVPKSVTSLLKAHNACAYSTFVHLGGSRVCLLASSEFSGPYSRTLKQFGEVDKMSIAILVFEFQVSEDRKAVAAEFLFHQVLGYFDSSTDATHAQRKPKTSAAHMVGGFLV